MKKIHTHAHKDISLSKRALKLSIGAIAGIFVLEAFGGFYTNSLALLSDAVHVFMDLLSFVLSYSAIVFAERSESDSRTFGWHRIEVFAAVINALTVGLAAIFIIVHGVKRLSNPQEILTMEMLAIAFVGLLANCFVIWKLHPHVGQDLNVRSAFVHAYGDAAASVAVVVGGVLVYLTGNHMIDAMVAILVALIIMTGALSILRDSVNILLEGTPKGLQRGLIVSSIEDISGKESVRDLHIWNLCSHICVLTVHIFLEEGRMAEQKSIIRKINQTLEEKFNITHSTIQLESVDWHGNA